MKRRKTKRTRSDIVADVVTTRNRPRLLSAEQLVPNKVRQFYANLWREEHLELQRVEHVNGEYRWRAIWRRFIDRIAGPVKEPPKTEPKYPFQG